MPMLHIHLEGDGSLRELCEGRQVIDVTSDMHVTGLDRGMTSGKPSVAFGFLLPDGRVAFAQTSLTLFLFAADALRARFGDPR